MDGGSGLAAGVGTSGQLVAELHGGGLTALNAGGVHLGAAR